MNDSEATIEELAAIYIHGGIADQRFEVFTNMSGSQPAPFSSRVRVGQKSDQSLWEVEVTTLRNKIVSLWR